MKSLLKKHKGLIFILLFVVVLGVVIFIPRVRQSILLNKKYLYDDAIIKSLGGSVLGQIKNWGDKSIQKAEQFLKLQTELSVDDLQLSEKKEVIARVGVMSDSHGATNSIAQAISEMRRKSVSLIIHLGDFTAGGENRSFKEAKEILEASGIKYLVMPGDHDFNWSPEYSRQNYEAAFDESYDQIYQLGNITLVLFENSIEIGNYAEKKDWLKKVLGQSDEDKLVIFFSPRPLYSPYFPDKVDPRGGEIIELLKEARLEYTIAGNTHIFARYQDLHERINIVTVGAVGEYKNPLPQWVLIEVFDDYSLEVRPQPIIEF